MSHVTVATLQDQVKEMEEKCQKFSEQESPFKYIHSLREYSPSAQQPGDYPFSVTLLHYVYR